MAPTQLTHGLDTRENDVDTIDLTLSSPEPEQRPRTLPRQSQLPNFFKSEPRPDSMRHVKNDQDKAVGHGRDAVPHQQTRRLAQIINTSSSADLKKVILHLCQLSPALSGAVARGLAHHSPFAQGPISRHGNKPRKPTPIEDDAFCYERQRQRLAARNKVKQENSRLPASVPESNQSRAMQRVDATQRYAVSTLHDRLSTPRVKHGIPPASLDSDSDTDNVHVPGAFPRSSQRANMDRTPLRDMLESSSATNHTPKSLPVSERLASFQRESAKEDRLCSQCHETFTKEDDVCFYHPGREFKQEGTVATWSCCNGSLSDLGCKFGSHVDPETQETGQPVSVIKPGSQTLSCAQCHEPFQGEFEGCIFHPGRKIKREGGMAVYSCCTKPVGTRGCQEGSHIDPAKAYKRLGPSPSPYKSQQKKLRIL
ncbi:Nn.00g023340.m01.CDS01 [Neocucurbitaria sp. VM-36]